MCINTHDFEWWPKDPQRKQVIFGHDTDMKIIWEKVKKDEYYQLTSRNNNKFYTNQDSYKSSKWNNNTDY